MTNLSRRLPSIFFIMILLLFGSFIRLVNADETTPALSNQNQLDEKFTHFELRKGEKIELIEPYASLWDTIRGKSENYKYDDYRGVKFTAMELLHPLGILINKTAPKGTAVLAESLIKKIDTKNSIMNEILLTATSFFEAMETRAAFLPPSAGQAAVIGAELVTQAIANSAVEQYSEAVKAKLEETFKEVYDKYKLDLEKGSIEKVRQALFEKTLNALNEYMASYYDPNEYVFKGLILGGHAKGDLLKYVDTLAKKTLPPIIAENGHIKGSVGVILHSPRKVTTINTFNTHEVKKEQTVFTVTPAIWLTARFKQNQISSSRSQTSKAKSNRPVSDNTTITPSTAESNKTTSKFVSPADSLYWTAGSIWGEREIDVATLDSYEGLFLELNVFIMGFTVNINQAFFFKEITHASTPSASAISFSIEHNGFKKMRREELKNGLGKIRFIPNAGYLNVFPIKNYSMDISTL